MEENKNKQQVSIIKFIWQAIFPYRVYFLLIIQAPIIGGLLVPTEQYIIKSIVDTLVKSTNTSVKELMAPIILFILVQVLLDSIWRICHIGEYHSVPFIKSRITQQAFQRITEYSYNFFQENFSGTISTKINNLSASLDKIYENIKLHIIHPIVMIVAAIFFLYSVSVLFVIVMIVFYLVFFPSVYYLSKTSHNYAADYARRKQNLTGLINDTLSNIVSVFSFSNKNKEVHAVEQSLSRVIKSEKILIRREFILNLVVGILYVSVSIGNLFLLIYLRELKEISVGDFVLVLGLTGNILQVAYILVMNLKVLARDIGDLKQSFSIFDSRYEDSVLDGNHLKLTRSPSISFKDVTFSYAENVIFENLNLEIFSGEKIGIVGSTGAGKSTLINILLGYFSITSGEIKMDNFNIATLSKDSLRQTIAVIPQDVNLFHRTLKENIAYGRSDVTMEKIVSVCKKVQLHNYIKSLPKGYETVVGERGTKLSGGQRQRIAIARAILKDSPILILDEATSSLDSETEVEIQKCLDIVIQEKDKTVIAIAHRLSTLKNMNRILVLEKGKIIESGAHEELIRKPSGTYYNLWKLQKLSCNN